MIERESSGLPFTAESPSAKALLAGLQWTKLDAPEPGEAEDMPYATHSAVLQIPGLPRLRVYQLNTGQRIIDADDVADFFAGRGEEW